ncbi:MAG: hypothetical protein IPO58_23530 [Betaproteobacteria bacterium]|nr:hypothetical protein [Betaproteobacteria bacterium]
MHAIADPRPFPPHAVPSAEFFPDWQRWAEQSQEAATGQEREAADSRLRAAMVDALRGGQAAVIETTLNAAATAAVYRHLWRALGAAWQEVGAGADERLVAHAFALPVVVVAAAAEAMELSGVLSDITRIVDLLQAHGALAGNRNFGLANVLAGADALGPGAMSRWLDWRRASDRRTILPDVRPSPIAIAAGQEGAHLRFLVGTALAAPRAVLLGERSPGAWGMPLAQDLSRQLAAEGAQLLALPRAPADPLDAVRQGRLAQREVALQLFASSAIRKLRADFGEPSAVISSHRTDAGGELRLSLSSPFGERDAEGFRCPLYPFDSLEDVLNTIVDLLRACRIRDIKSLAQVHPDRDPETGSTLLFRADAPGAADSASLH